MLYVNGCVVQGPVVLSVIYILMYFIIHPWWALT